MRTFLLTCLLFALLFETKAQKSTIYSYDLKDFDHAVALYNKHQYASAQVIFKKISSNLTSESAQSDCEFYIADCAIKANDSNSIVLMKHFIETNPTSNKQNVANFSVGNKYFEQKEYSKALEYYEKVNANDLESNFLEQFYFEKGYCFFDSKNKKVAADNFEKVLNSKKYGSQAKYYMGFMAYDSDDYKQANKYFNEVSTDEKFKEKLSYYQADMNFKLQNFQNAIDLAQKAMVKSDDVEKSELNKIIGESYFNLDQYNKAIPYLEAYKGKKGKWNNTDYYQLGYAYYNQKEYQKAINQFNKIIDGKDGVTQNAYYNLAESYLKLNKKQEALNAYKNASELNFDSTIQENAALNYAKLSYEIGNSYQSTPAILQAFLDKYPKNTSVGEVEKLLINSYISSKNYKEALILLEKNKNQENKEAYQKVLFYRGLEFYNESNYNEAINLFNKSIKEPYAQDFLARAIFWKAESEFVINDFKNALLDYKQFLNLPQSEKTTEFKNVNYNIAYSYFKLKEYDQAAMYFKNQIETINEDKTRFNDASLRFADCLFVTAKYQQALEAYTKVIQNKSVDTDYASFQKAICYGFISKNDKKIDELKVFVNNYPKSLYRDDALFELANTYNAANKQDLALKTYEQLNSEFKSGSFTSKVLLRQGLIYYSSDKNDLALAKLKKVIVDFPKTPEATEALSTARLIYIDNGKVDEYALWVRTLEFVSIPDADLDNDSYLAVEKQLQQGNTKQAENALNKYLTSFPKGIHALEANFNLGQIYFAQGLENKAVSNYEYVINQPRNEFTEQSLARISNILLIKKNTEKAIPFLIRLENEADYPQNKTFAQSNLMKCYYENKDYANATVYAEKVLNNPKADAIVKNDSQIIIARSAMQTNNEAKAKTYYAKILPNAKGELAAESLYYEAYFKNKESNYEASNTTIQKLAKNYSSYRYYGAKGLILMAKNFYGLKDGFQATYILESVIKNFTDFADLTSQAQQELEIIKAEEAKTNSSITK